MEKNKQLVKDFWNEASCGEDLYLKGNDAVEQFSNQLKIRYQLEPFILSFGEFESLRNKQVLEIGVGLGADHQKMAENGAILQGCDLTERAIQHTQKRFDLLGLKTNLQVADAEQLPYSDNQFDAVYSWGVIHHSPNTPKAVDEIYRVLKPNGTAKIMIYHKNSMVGYMLWIRYALLKFKPFTSLKDIYATYLESPGTKAYSVAEAKLLFKDFSNVEIDTVLTHGDLLSSNAGQRHKGILLTIARMLFPRWIIKTFFPKQGLFMLITAVK